MARNKQKLINLHTSTADKKPEGLLSLGEIAVEHSSVNGAKLYVTTVENGTAENIATFITENAINSKIATEHEALESVSAQSLSNASAIASHQEAYEALDEIVEGIQAWPASSITVEHINKWNAAESNAMEYTDEELADLKTTIDAYTVNGLAISTNPVLDGADIKLDGYTKAAETSAIAATDTVNQALGKLEKAIEDTGGDAISLIEAGNGIEVSEKANHKQTVSAKVNVTADNGVKLTLGTDGIGIQVDAVESAISTGETSDSVVAAKAVAATIAALDATAGTQTVTSGKHVAVEVVETDGKITAVNVAEDDIASADNLEALSGVVETFSGAVETAIESAADAAKSYIDTAISSEVSRADAAYADIAYEAKVNNFIGTDTSKTARGIAQEERDTAISSASSMDTALKSELIGDMTGSTKTLGALQDEIENVESNLEVTMTTGGTAESILKSYTFKQGDTTIGTVDIPKDLVVKSGEIVEKDGKKYLELTLTNDQVIDIDVEDLCDVYAGSDNIEISTGNVITVKSGIFDAFGAADDVEEYVVENYATSAATVAADSAVLSAAESYTNEAINALDATVGGTDIAEGKHVAVEIAEVDGKLTTVTVTEDIAGDNIKLDNYSSGSSTAAIVASDTVNQALGKLENKVAAAVAGGITAVTAGDGIAVDTTNINNPEISVDMSDLVATDADAGVALAIDSNNVKVTVTEGSIAEGNTSVVLGGQVYEAIDALDADKTGTTADGFISVEVHESAGKITAVTTTDKVVAITAATSSNKGLAEASDVAAELTKKADAATTLAGYGIADAYTKDEADSAITTAIDSETARTETAYAKKATTLAGYGITDAYTKDESDAKFAAAEHTHTKSEITDFGEYLSASTKYVANAVQTDGDSACTTTFTIKQAGSEDSTITIKHDYVIDCGTY